MLTDCLPLRALLLTVVGWVSREQQRTLRGPNVLEQMRRSHSIENRNIGVPIGSPLVHRPGGELGDA